MTEAWLLVEARLGHYFADRLWKSAAEGIFELLHLDIDDLKQAFVIESKYPKAAFGIVDCTCFVLCERYKIPRVFTYDKKHFSLYRPKFTSFLELLPT